MGFKVEIRTDCKICGNPLPNARFRTFCSAKCRNKSNNKKRTQAGAEWQRKKRDAEASIPSEHKCQCLVCGKWYFQVGSHVHQVHKLSAREYREFYYLEVKRGITPDWYRELKGEQAIENGTFRNLSAGEKFRFKKGQEGIGVYKRSPITVDRIKGFHKLKKQSKEEKNGE